MDEIRIIVLRERQQSLSDREWRHRLAGHGYRVEESGGGFVVSSITRGEALLTL